MLQASANNPKRSDDTTTGPPLVTAPEQYSRIVAIVASQRLAGSFSLPCPSDRQLHNDRYGRR